MTSPVLQEAYYTAGFLVSEANGLRSRDAGLIVNDGDTDLQLGAGTVMAKNTVGSASSAAKAGNTGNGTLTMDAATPVLAGARPGVYTVRCIAAAANGGTFRVEDPDGNVLGDVAVGATFADQVQFVVADGAADFVVGDGFDITVAAGDGKWVPFINSPLQTDLAILYNRCTVRASASASATLITRDAEVNASELLYDASLTGGALTAAKAAAAKRLAIAGIVLR